MSPNNRDGRLFFVSTTTSTLSTTTLCYVVGTTSAACTGRKKRMIALEAEAEQETPSISPDQPQSVDHYFWLD